MKHFLFRPILLRGKFFQNWWYQRLTPAGQWLLGGIAVSMIGLRSLQVPAYGMFCALTALYVVARLAGILFRPHVTTQVELPDKSVAGGEVQVKVQVTNRGRWTSLDISVNLLDIPSTWSGCTTDRVEAALRPGESAQFVITFVPKRRGTFPWPALRVFSTYPFNLFRHGPTQTLPGNLVVVPSFEPLQQIDPGIGSRIQAQDVSSLLTVGNSPEYLGNRDYVAGDELRRLDFRSWARLGKPYVREYQEEGHGRVALILDTYIAEPNQKRRAQLEDTFEAAIEFAASVADAISREQIALEIFAAGPELFVFRSYSNRTSIDTVLEVLAGVQPSSVNTFDKVAASLIEQLDDVSTAICILLDWDEARNALSEEILHAGCGAKVVVVHKGPTTRPLEATEELVFFEFTPEEVRGGKVNEI